MTKNKTEYYTTLFEFTTVKNKRVEIKRTKNWEINIIQTAKSLGKRWRLTRNQKTIEVYEKLAGRKLVRRTDHGYPQTFLDLTLALRIISRWDLVLSYRIFKLAAQELYWDSSNMCAELNLLEQVEQELVTLKKTIDLSWTNFDVEFAFYYLVADNVVKCGAVGLKDQENSENLESRLASHGSTHARLKLINVIKFKDSKTVTLFENWIKLVLEKYSIGTNASLEQYECPGKNSEEIFNEIILEKFDRINKLKNGDAGSLCPPRLINDYNETMGIKTKTKIN